MYFSVHAYASYSIKDNLRLYVHLFGLSYCSMWNMLISPDFEVRLRNQNAATTFEPMLGFFLSKASNRWVFFERKYWRSMRNTPTCRFLTPLSFLRGPRSFGVPHSILDVDVKSGKNHGSLLQFLFSFGSFYKREFSNFEKFTSQMFKE